MFARQPSCQDPSLTKLGYNGQASFVICRVPYVTRLLREGLGVPEAQTRIGSGREGWTLGAALAEGSKVGAGRGPKRKMLSRTVLFGVAGAAYALWLVFLAGALRRTVCCPSCWKSRLS